MKFVHCKCMHVYYGVILLLSGIFNWTISWCSAASLDNITVISDLDTTSAFRNIGPETSCLLPDGICNDEENNLYCGFDGGDCLDGGNVNITKDFPDCLQALEGQNPFALFENWNRHTENIGNEKCDTGLFNIEECGFEFGECVDFNDSHPLCNVPGAASSLGDGSCDWSYNYVECEYDGGDCRKASIFLGIVVGFITLSTVAGITFRHARTGGGGQEDFDPPLPRPFQAATDDKEVEELRRKFILSRIIHKKVLSGLTKTDADKDIDADTGHHHIQQSADALISPHEQIMHKRNGVQLLLANITRTSNNSKVVSDTNTDTKTNMDEESDKGEASKEDVYVEQHRDNANKYDHFYSPKTCPICMESYTDGDDIAWSYNESCSHVFHRECIVRWLMKHDDCPMCRSQYLFDAVDDDPDPDPNANQALDTDTDPDIDTGV